MKNKWLLLLVVLGIIFSVNNSFAQENAFTEQVIYLENYGQKIVADLTLPDSETPVPAVLLLHGFTGERQELPLTDTGKGLFQHLAQSLKVAGIASLRIDFRGSGQSEGLWEETTFSGQISDALIALAYLGNLQEIDADAIGVLGFSQGGLVAASAGGRSLDVKSMVLWAPVANPAFTYGQLLGADNLLKAANAEDNEAFSAVLPWGDTVTLYASFYKELITISPLAEITSYTNPLLVLAGYKDDVVEPQPQVSQAFLNYHDGLQKLLMFDTDHVFDCFTTDEFVKAIIAESVQWFLDTL